VQIQRPPEMTKKTNIPIFILLIITLLLPFMAMSNTYEVNSVSTFNSAQNNASSGDTIVWKQGLYYDIDIVVYKWDLVVMAEIPGKTVFSGASKLKIAGSNNTITGFQYLGGNIGSGNVIDIEGSSNLVTQVNIKDYYCYKYLIIRELSEYTTISYCNFENRTFIGDQNILSVLVAPNKPGYHTIRHCSFKNFEGTTPGGDAGVEAIRIGLSSQGENISRTTVEYCYFTQCNGDSEIISHKSKQNVYRYNTFEDNPYGELVLRHGDGGIVYGNFFLDGYGGVRIKEGQDHIVYNNYFSGINNRAINLQNYSVDPLQRILIAYNTIIGSAKTSLGGSGAYPPADVTFANNIFHNPSEDVFSDPTETENWLGNIFNGDLGISPLEGLSDLNPELELNSEGFYQLAQTSPAIDASQQGFPPISEIPDLDIDHEILLDIMKQDRPTDITLKDVGCNEFSDQLTVQPHATSDNTGPTYLQNQDFVLLRITTDGNGTVVTDPPAGVYNAGEEVTITAEPGQFEAFQEWMGDISSTDNPVTITMDQDKNVTAVFERLNTNTIQIFMEGEGDVTIDPPGGEYLDDTQVTLTATPAEGYAFDQWTGNIFSTDNPLEITINSDLILFANFSPATNLGEWPLISHNAKVMIYPNPVTNVIEIGIPHRELFSIKEVKLFDVNGVLVTSEKFHKTLNNQQDSIMLDVSQLPSGVFAVRFYLHSLINTQVEVITGKFVKL
jgi:hypothetical protein